MNSREYRYGKSDDHIKVRWGKSGMRENGEEGVGSWAGEERVEEKE